MKLEIDDYEALTVVMDDIQYLLKKENIGFKLFKLENESQKMIYEEKE